MNQTAAAAIREHFGELTDPRRREPTYPLLEMVTMALCAVICGADDFVAIAKYARTKKEWFSSFLDLSNGIPSHDRFNEITAIPKLLELIEISGALVTIDAMGCQTAIAETIVDAGADYCLAVKRNQPTLHDGIEAFLSPHLDNDFAETNVRRHVSHDTTHGRDVQRFSFLLPVPQDLPDRHRWKGLKAMAGRPGWPRTLRPLDRPRRSQQPRR